MSYCAHAGSLVADRDLLAKNLFVCLCIVAGDDASAGGFAVVQMSGLMLHTCIVSDPVFVNHIRPAR